MTSQSNFSACMHDQMLESNRDDVKLEAMRCVTVMTAKGKLTVPRTLFPHIVKNVSSKNPELKKLIYLYLTSFADQEPDLALLPVATLQKSMKNPNPLIRSSALKVLTSMRLSILLAILMATLRNSVNDLSPYVRKTVAHAIIKIYRLDPNLKGDLVEYIERLFNDKNSMVLSSAVAAFEIVCPERIDLVHQHYKRFCSLLADCNEWGQTLLLKLLVRYVTEAPALAKSGKLADFNASENDPKVLLRAAKPLFHSNNSAVVMAVIKLYITIANHIEVRSTITKPMLRLLYSHREIQLITLNMIEDLTTTSEKKKSELTADKDPGLFKEMFRPFIKSFFIKHTDCTQIRLAKLRILSNLNSSVNVSLIIRELQAYISTYADDKEFVSAAIRSLGNCAIVVKEVAPTCLNGLTTLLSNNNEHIVSEAIVVLRSQIMNEDMEDDESRDNGKIVSTVIKQVTRLLPTVTAPKARATILWILAEFCDKNRTAAKCAPNVLRLIAKSFGDEDSFVKLQSLTLASKYLLSLHKEQKADLYHKLQLLTNYLFSLAKYDVNHDVRDRGRFLRKLLEEEEICSRVLNCGQLSTNGAGSALGELEIRFNSSPV